MLDLDRRFFSLASGALERGDAWRARHFLRDRHFGLRPSIPSASKENLVSGSNFRDTDDSRRAGAGGVFRARTFVVESNILALILKFGPWHVR